MRNKDNLVGMRYGLLEVVALAADKVYKSGKKTQYLCKCDCGKTKTILAASLVNGRTTSCGCIRKEQLAKRSRKHGCAGERLYVIWIDMKARCNNAAANNYHCYGGRGISVCKEWVNDFSAFQLWAVSNGYNDNLTLDRINVNGNYEPGNCRWATTKEQGFNKRTNRYLTLNGETYTVTEWSKKTGLPLTTIVNRLRNGWPVERALSKGSHTM